MRNRLITVTDHGQITRFEYDVDGNLKKRTDAKGKEVRYDYDLDGRLIKTTDGNGNVIEQAYDDLYAGCTSCGGAAANQPSAVHYPTFTRELRYDLRGRKTVEMDDLGNDDALITVTDHGLITRFEYDPAGNLKVRTDKSEKSTYYEYDAQNRLTRVTDPGAGETIYEYDRWDNFTKLTDAESQVTQFMYDGNNRLVKEIRPLLQETAYDYDGAGNLAWKIDAKNQKTAYGYDDAGRLETIEYYADASDATPMKTVSFTYNPAGDLKGYDDGQTSATYTYDDAGRKIGETVNYGDFEKTIAYDHYANGLTKTFTAPDGTIYTYAYDDANQLTEVQIPSVGAVIVNAYNWNRPETVTLPGGSVKSFGYDPLMRLDSLSFQDPGENPLLTYGYEYDPMDNITAKTTEHGDYGYDYDDLYRLKTVDNPAQEDEAYTYDKVGNRRSSAATTGDWGYDDNNQLEGYDDVAFTYDDNGNTVKKVAGAAITSYVYNIENRLSEVYNGEAGSGSLTARYYYDPFGRRLWKEVGGVKTCFVYADEGLVAETDSLGTITRTYGYKPGSTWSTDPLFMQVGGEYYFYHNDHLGTPQKMTAVNGEVVWEALYGAFGEAQVLPASRVESNFRFAGQYFDAETGLHYNYHRYYDPEIGRYLRADPIGLEGGINLYAYTSNNPINAIDPYGLEARVFQIIREGTETLSGGLNSGINDAVDTLGWNDPNLARRIQSDIYYSLTGHGKDVDSYDGHWRCFKNCMKEGGTLIEGTASTLSSCIKNG